MSLTLVPPLHPTTPSYAAALAELSSVSLETLAAQAGRMTRIDRKYVIPADDLDAVFSSTAHEAVALEIDGRRTFGYSSIYFDTPDLRSFHDGGRRRRRRFKVRARSYLDSDLHFLEVKTRGARGTTVKERQSLPHPVHGGLDPAGQKFVATTLAAHGIPDLDPRDLTDAVRAGRSLMSEGAFARVTTADGGGLGDLVRAPGGSVDLNLRVEAIPEIDVTHAIVFVNCDEVAKLAATDPHGTVKLATTVSVPVDRDATIVVAGFGRERLPRGLASFDAARRPRFLTNPILVDRDGNGRFDAPGGKTCTYDLSPP